jgi:hypothetical protein
MNFSMKQQSRSLKQCKLEVRQQNCKYQRQLQQQAMQWRLVIRGEHGLQRMMGAILLAAAAAAEALGHTIRAVPQEQVLQESVEQQTCGAYQWQQAQTIQQQQQLQARWRNQTPGDQMAAAARALRQQLQQMPGVAAAGVPQAVAGSLIGAQGLLLARLGLINGKGGPATVAC